MKPTTERKELISKDIIIQNNITNKSSTEKNHEIQNKPSYEEMKEAFLQAREEIERLKKETEWLNQILDIAEDNEEFYKKEIARLELLNKAWIDCVENRDIEISNLKQQLAESEIFLDHIYSHKKEIPVERFRETRRDDWVMCKICGSTVNEIKKQLAEAKKK